ncbi:MAG: PKD domain-containing protein [Salinivirgaceae bacterium]|jgi:PKD repeat protein|nr:PKD domain-containing protein [Salinivirgaceae bacterium]
MTYSWDFGDSTPAVTDKTPNHTYAAAGTYTVTLTTKGVTGALDQKNFSKVVTVL